MKPDPRRLRRTLLSLLAMLTVIAGGLTAAFGAGFTEGSAAYAAGEHTVTFVNRSAEKVWVGSTVNADGSVNFGQLPILEPGASATIVIPENSGPGHWRGKFFARQRCGGEPFHCEVGDCGTAVDHCAINGEQDASLAEFNFDPADPGGAPWYDVSYVNAVSLPITITPTGAPAPPPGTQYCAEAGCAKPLLDACPASDLKRDGQGQPLLCVNPNRDAVTEYSDAVKKACPRAYSWSKDDATAGNQTMYNCKECTGFTVTFHGNGPGTGPVVAPPPVAPNEPPPPAAADTQIVSNWHGKCIDVPGGDYSDRVRLAVWDCWNGPMQRFQLGADGTIRMGGKCLDVADGSTAEMAAVQVFTCNGTPAQQWVLTEAADLVNPQADKCVDIAAWNADNGAPLQLWTCNGMVNQKWHRA